MFNNKNILITGGTGSFGQNFAKFIVKNYKPRKLIIFSRDELKQYEMSLKFPLHKFKFMRFFLGDIRDGHRLDKAFEAVDYVIHAAALKNVPILEYNPLECIKTNIIGSQNVIDSALKNKVKKVVALSTDKAANPINLYGATKLAADKLFSAAKSIAGKQKTLFSVVRYGNVLGSRGSIVPYFKSLIEKNEKYLPITDKRMTRFWITLDEACQFVIDKMKIMKGSEIFVPKIPSVKIIDLALAMKSNVKLRYVGIRPGEKIYEVMCPRDDYHRTIEFKHYYLICPSTGSNFFKKYGKSIDGELGKKVKENFEYNSETNPKFLNIEQIRKKIAL